MGAEDTLAGIVRQHDLVEPTACWCKPVQIGPGRWSHHVGPLVDPVSGIPEVAALLRGDVMSPAERAAAIADLPLCDRPAVPRTDESAPNLVLQHVTGGHPDATIGYVPGCPVCTPTPPLPAISEDAP